jgi:hypothetical protein
MYINNDGLPAYLDLASKVGRLVRQAGDVAARSRLEATNPLPTGSFAEPNAIGMSDVLCSAARTAPPDVTMTSTLNWTKSAAICVKRSSRPSAQRYSIPTVRPSI